MPCSLVGTGTTGLTPGHDVLTGTTLLPTPTTTSGLVPSVATVTSLQYYYGILSGSHLTVVRLFNLLRQIHKQVQ